MSYPREVDLLIVGGGINGAGIARDAAGRGVTVMLVEQDDLASATSSASSKLIHGGLRYLEQLEFRLVHEALAEREVLLKCAPHIVHPTRFVVPHVPELRPAWMMRAGLFLYDYLARRQTLPPSRSVDLRRLPYGSGLKPGMKRGFVYSDCRVDDARLVVANAMAAAELGAKILTRTSCVEARRDHGGWQATLAGPHGAAMTVRAKALVNACGPWARKFLNDRLHQSTPFTLKLVKGSHVLVPRLYDGDHAFILQNDDRRVVFVYPYEGHMLIGTTDVEFEGEPGPCLASPEEIRYLCRAANRYFSRQVTESEVVWSYCGIRSLLDDGSTNASAITRDYVLRIDGDFIDAPVLSVFGGKITVYRKLAERALEKLARWFPRMTGSWTAQTPLPGGDFGGASFDSFVGGRLQHEYPWLPAELRLGLARRHGGGVPRLLGNASAVSDLGEHFGGQLYAREVDYMIAHEWVRTAEDALWRRSKEGLHLSAESRQSVTRYVAKRAG